MQKNVSGPYSRAAIPLSLSLSLSPSLDATLAAACLPRQFRPLDRRVLWVTAVAIALGVIAGVVARLLTALIGLFTNLAFYGRLSLHFVSPADNQLGLWVIAVPVIGGLVH